MGLQLYRQRLIPKETVLLKDDVILLHTPELLITKWETLKPRSDFKFGFSCYYIKKGYKISRIYSERKHFLFTYIDIITSGIDGDVYTFTDMLVDIVIMPNGRVKVLDLDELAEALEQRLITPDALIRTLRRTDALLKIIYAGQLMRYTAELNGIIKEHI